MTETESGPRTIASTVAALPGSAADRFADNVASRYRVGGEWRELSYREEVRSIEEVALGLADIGIQVGDRVAILSDTRLEWTVASHGISVAGAIVVPVYPTSSPSECEWVLGDSGACALICENAAQVEKIEQLRERLPELATVICIEPGCGDLSLVALQERGRGRDRSALADRQAAVAPEDAYEIIYTSGTTGPPKGVVLTHRNAMSVCEMVQELEFISSGEVSYLYLPLAHVFAQTVHLASFDLGTTIVYYGGDTRLIVEELIASRPTYLPSVPRVFEKIYTAAMKMRDQGGEEDRARFDQAIRLGVEVRRRRERAEPVSDELRQAFEAADERLYVRVRGLFGGQIKQAVSGAAPIASEILEFFYACGVPVLEGWGMTETAAVGTVCTLGHIKFGTVGRPLPGVELKIAEQDGEILVRGPNVFSGYWRNPAATASALVDGWLHTGDLGDIDDEGYLTITGRKKDIIITAGGKNLAPSNIENDLKQSRFISQVVMHGDRRPYPVALITLDPDEIIPWASEHGLPEDLAELAASEAVSALVQAELDRANANYAPVEQIKRFAILGRDLSIEEGELTPTLKVKRSVVNDRYSDLLDSLYERPRE